MKIIAEISNAHNGDRDRCGRLIDAAQQAGADIVKFQCYTPDELVARRGDGPAPEPWGSQGYTMRSLYERARTPLEWFPKIREHCERIGMPWFSSVFGAESLDTLERIGCPKYKVSHFERVNGELATMLRATEKMVYVSSRTPLPAMWGASRWIYCIDGYPSALDSQGLADAEGDAWGVSTHCVDPVIGACCAALYYGSLEVHFHLKDEPSALEANVSYDETQFAELVSLARRAERACR